MCYKTSKQFFFELSKQRTTNECRYFERMPKADMASRTSRHWRLVWLAHNQNKSNKLFFTRPANVFVFVRTPLYAIFAPVKKATRIGNRIRTNIVRYLQEVPQRRWFSAPSFDALDTPVSSPCRAKRHTMQSSTLKKRNVTHKKPEQQPEQQRRTSIACRIDLFSSTSRPDNNASATSANTRRPSCVPNRTRICEKKRNSI